MSDVTQAASVLLSPGPRSAEVFTVRRATALRFFGGFHAFPGGRLDPEDAAVPLVPAAAEVVYPPQRYVAAARELFEETGALLARRPDGSFPCASPTLEEYRRRAVAGEVSFAQVLHELGLRLHAADFLPLGSTTTPAFSPLRYDTAFFLAQLPPEQCCAVWSGELDHGEWITAAQLLQRWRRGDCLVSPPSVLLLQALGEGPVEQAVERLRGLLRTLGAATIRPIYFAPGVQLIPLRTMSLPPSTHTNAFLLGEERLLLIDPGPADPEEQDRLFQVVDARLAGGGRLEAIVLTHHHPDHVGAAAASAARYGVPVLAHPWTAAALDGEVAVSRAIHEGDRLDLGPAPDGSGPWYIEAVHTPGHAPGHLAFYEPRYRLLLAGDMVSTLSSVVIAPPDGDLALYLASLRRLRGYDCRLLLPSHGGPTIRGRQTLDDAIAHRVKREEQLVAALAADPRAVPDLATDLYRGLPEQLRRFAELQVLAGLLKLEQEGRVERQGTTEAGPWRLRAPA